MLGYYEGEEDILDDNEQAALVPMEGEKTLCLLCACKGRERVFPFF